MALSTLPGRTICIRLPTFTGYAYGSWSVANGSPHMEELPYQMSFPLAQTTTTKVGQLEHLPQQHQRRMPHKEQQQTNSHDSIDPHLSHHSQNGHEHVDGFGRPDLGSPSSIHRISLSEYTSRAIGALADTVGVAQYLPPMARAHDLTTQLTAGYHQHVPLSDPFPASDTHQTAVMTGYNSTSAALSAGTPEYTRLLASRQRPMDQRQIDLHQNSVGSLGEAFGRYQHALSQTFDFTRAGRLVDASRSLLEISEWLVGNARELGTSCGDSRRCHNLQTNLYLHIRGPCHIANHVRREP